METCYCSKTCAIGPELTLLQRLQLFKLQDSRSKCIISCVTAMSITLVASTAVLCCHKLRRHLEVPNTIQPVATDQAFRFCAKNSASELQSCWSVGKSSDSQTAVEKATWTSQLCAH